MQEKLRNLAEKMAEGGLREQIENIRFGRETEVEDVGPARLHRRLRPSGLVEASGTPFDAEPELVARLEGIEEVLRLDRPDPSRPDLAVLLIRNQKEIARIAVRGRDHAEELHRLIGSREDALWQAIEELATALEALAQYAGDLEEELDAPDDREKDPGREKILSEEEDPGIPEEPTF